MKKHPLEKARELNEPYVYWHRREIHRKTVEEAIAYDEDSDRVYIGHPKEFYIIEKKIPMPNNIAIDDAIGMLRGAEDVIVILDCKHKKALPKIKEIIEILGSHRCILHSFIKEWSEPYPSNIHMEAHWAVEDVPCQDIKNFIDQTGVKCIGAIHALYTERVEREKLLERAFSMAKGFESISVYLPGVKVPPVEYLQQILDNGYLPWISQDEVVKRKQSFDFTYVGMADNLELATITKDFLRNK